MSCLRLLATLLLVDGALQTAVCYMHLTRSLSAALQTDSNKEEDVSLQAYINAFAGLLVDREGDDSAAQAADQRLKQLTGELVRI